MHALSFPTVNYIVAWLQPAPQVKHKEVHADEWAGARVQETDLRRAAEGRGPVASIRAL